MHLGIVSLEGLRGAKRGLHGQLPPPLCSVNWGCACACVHMRVLNSVKVECLGMEGA